MTGGNGYNPANNNHNGNGTGRAAGPYRPEQQPAAAAASPARCRWGPDEGQVLLALDAGVRETGWAIFRSGQVAATGTIRLPRSRRLDAAGRVEHLLRCLDDLAARWRPAAVAYGQPYGIRWPTPSLELLDAALVNWSAGRRLPLYTYPAQEVRAALSRHSHVPREQVAYAVMARLGLIGQGKTTPEWDALAVGCYHLGRWPAEG